MDYYLQHWGVKGQRWGVRRYQNKDGTLTPAGKKRYDKEMAKLKEESKILRNRERTQAKLKKLEDARQDIASRKKALEPERDDTGKKTKVKPSSNPKKMTDEELTAKINRMNLENRYAELMASRNPPKSTAGKDFTKKMLAQTADSLLPQVTKHFGAKLLNNLIGQQKRVKNEETGQWETILDEVIFANNKKK